MARPDLVQVVELPIELAAASADRCADCRVIIGSATDAKAEELSAVLARR